MMGGAPNLPRSLRMHQCLTVSKAVAPQQPSKMERDRAFWARPAYLEKNGNVEWAEGKGVTVTGGGGAPQLVS